jgi:hypothetical protein
LVVAWDVLRVRLETELERAATGELVGVDWSRPAFRQNRRFSSDRGSIVKASDSFAEMWVMRRWGSGWRMSRGRSIASESVSVDSGVFESGFVSVIGGSSVSASGVVGGSSLLSSSSESLSLVGSESESVGVGLCGLGISDNRTWF